MYSLEAAVFDRLPADDKARWYKEGFRFNATAPVRFGLKCVALVELCMPPSPVPILFECSA